MKYKSLVKAEWVTTYSYDEKGLVPFSKRSNEVLKVVTESDIKLVIGSLR